MFWKVEEFEENEDTYDDVASVLGGGNQGNPLSEFKIKTVKFNCQWKQFITSTKKLIWLNGSQRRSQQIVVLFGNMRIVKTSLITEVFQA